MIPENHAGNQYAEALVKAWTEYNNPRLDLKIWSSYSSPFLKPNFQWVINFCSAVIMIVVQAEERNMYDQHCLSVNLRKRYPLFPDCQAPLEYRIFFIVHPFFLLFEQFDLSSFPRKRSLAL